MFVKENPDRKKKILLSLTFVFLTRLSFLSIADDLRKRYGDHRTLKLESLKRQTLSIRRLFYISSFKKICEDPKVIPKFINFKVANSNLRFSITNG